jgi:hypothetical protein
VKGTKTRTNQKKETKSKYIRREQPEYRERQREKKVMERFRCGKEERENRYWLEGEERRC